MDSINVSVPLTLPNGVSLKNRIVKAAMSEYMADASTNEVNLEIIQAYEYWSRSNAGLLLTGNVCVSKEFLEAPTNVSVTLEDMDNKLHFALLKQWALRVHKNSCLLVAQISHPGRQCPMSITYKPCAPSPIRLEMDFFFTPKELTVGEIEKIVRQFVDCAFVLHQAGFDGVQLHAAHGYLLSQFLSPKSNVRNDRYGGSLENRSRILMEIVRGVREKIKDKKFILGVKLNSSDFQKGGFDVNDAVLVCQALEKEKIDFIELSGGTYESSDADTGMLQDSDIPGTTKEREAFFIDFAKDIRKSLSSTPVMLTGGFRTVEGMNTALESKSVDLVGLARPFCTETKETIAKICSNQDIGRRLKSPAVRLVSKTSYLKDLNKGTESAWYAGQIARLGRGQEPDLNMSRWKFAVGMPMKYIFHPKKSRITLRRFITFLLVFFLVLRWIKRKFLR